MSAPSKRSVLTPPASESDMHVPRFLKHVPSVHTVRGSKIFSALPILLKVTSSSSHPRYLCAYTTLPTAFRKDKRWLTLKTYIGKISKIQKEKGGQENGSTLSILVRGLNPFALR